MGTLRLFRACCLSAGNQLQSMLCAQMFGNLGLDEGGAVCVRLVTLPQLQKCILQPLTTEIHTAYDDMGFSVSELLESALRSHTTLSAGTTVSLDILGYSVPVFVLQTLPSSPACRLRSSMFVLCPLFVPFIESLPPPMNRLCRKRYNGVTSILGRACTQNKLTS